VVTNYGAMYGAMFDVVGGQAVPSAPEPGMRYLPGQVRHGGYRVIAPPDRPIRIMRASGRIRLEDPVAGISVEGPSYLDAIQALSRAARERLGG
jgi:hypothetical protein